MSSSQIVGISENIRFLKAIDPLNARIIRECARQGPNNLSSIARSLRIPIETVRYRFNKLKKIGVFRSDIFARYSKLGLIRCAVFASASPNASAKLETAFSTVRYWIYLARSFGKDEGFYGLYALPYANRSDFEYYWNEAVKLGLLKDFQAVFTGDAYSTIPNFEWFSFRKHFWTFPWRNWIGVTESTSPKGTHPALTDPHDYNSKLDSADMKILSLLEADATLGLREIGGQLGFTASGVKYHWDNHIIAQGVVEGYRTITTGYPKGFADLYTIRFQCPDSGRLAQLVNFFSDKVFVVSYAKVLRENELIAHISIPKTEFENMMLYLYGIRRAGIISDFQFVRLDLSGYAAESITPANFKDGHWTYDLDSHLEKLHSIVVGRVESWPVKNRQHKGFSPVL